MQQSRIRRAFHLMDPMVLMLTIGVHTSATKADAGSNGTTDQPDSLVAMFLLCEPSTWLVIATLAASTLFFTLLVSTTVLACTVCHLGRRVRRCQPQVTFHGSADLVSVRCQQAAGEETGPPTDVVLAVEVGQAEEKLPEGELRTSEGGDSTDADSTGDGDAQEPDLVREDGPGEISPEELPNDVAEFPLLV